LLSAFEANAFQSELTSDRKKQIEQYKSSFAVEEVDEGST
jgi:hypothetical protein